MRKLFIFVLLVSPSYALCQQDNYDTENIDIIMNISPNKVKEILNSSSCRKDEELKLKLGRFGEKYEVYRYDSTNILLADVKSMYGTVYNDEVFLLKGAQNFNKMQPAQHILSGPFKYDQEFPNLVPKLLKKLESRLSISDEILDGSIESLKIIDSILRKFSNKEVEKLFPYLIAYSGFTILNQVGGEWGMEELPDASMHTPFIVGANGIVYNPYLKFAKMVIDGDHGFSLYDAVTLELRRPTK